MQRHRDEGRDANERARAVGSAEQRDPRGDHHQDLIDAHISSEDGSAQHHDGATADDQRPLRYSGESESAARWQRRRHHGNHSFSLGFFVPRVPLHRPIDRPVRLLRSRSRHRNARIQPFGLAQVKQTG